MYLWAGIFWIWSITEKKLKNGNIAQSKEDYSPSLPTINFISAISSLLNISKFLSRTVGFAACQLGSAVSTIQFELLAGKQKDVELNAPGDPNGDDDKLEQFCVTCIFSLCTLLGGDCIDPLLFPVITEKKTTQR
jgi:hypothetical protein